VTGVVALMWQKELSLGSSLAPEAARARIRANVDRASVARWTPGVDGYTFDGEREGVIWAPSAVGDEPPPPENLPPTVSITSPANARPSVRGAHLIRRHRFGSRGRRYQRLAGLDFRPAGPDRHGRQLLARSDQRCPHHHCNRDGFGRKRGAAIGHHNSRRVFAIRSGRHRCIGACHRCAGSAIAVTDTTRNQGTGSAILPSPGSTCQPTARSTPAMCRWASARLGVSAWAGQLGFDDGDDPGFNHGRDVLRDRAGGCLRCAGRKLRKPNNTRTDSIQIGPDLVVSAMSVPTTAGAGGTITVTDTSKNQGLGVADSCITRFYLSTNATFDAADTAVGERARSGIERRADSSGSTAVAIPAATAAGTYYIIARADAGNAVAETAETNNTRASSVAIGPDLAVSAMSVPTAPVPVEPSR